ncbi:hypothetical protein SAMN02799630_02084 [Paenibacillus sp. UNCCL117]|uniref:hypothetical protein n=1 Tax=unclassified Paenibacillus TaxID=185978 RepID=UPI0008807670|nr:MULTISPECIES: hypothetical protein [unclassified Paenibacillus]SDD01569.1 hypothetical protein SAMN04488602_10543 [Paenibacillus sp. cl123]SFW32650.1 hypothetical protein SAMN02799630_02084 [Paenibacillus sp. UNCCL117]
MRMEQVVVGLGFTAVAGGLVRMAMTPAALIWGTDSTQELWAGLIACWLMAIGSLGLFLAQVQQTGVLGLISSLALTLSNMITACLVWSTMLGAVPPDGSLVLPINSLLMLAGLVIFAAVTWRGGILPRWAAVLLLVWPFVTLIPGTEAYGAVLWGLAYIGLGLPVWLNKKAAPVKGWAEL